MTALRDTSELVAPAVEQAIDALGDQLAESDGAAAQLARRYAATIDGAGSHCAACDDPGCKRAPGPSWAMRWLAPLLLDALESLGASPAARARLKGGSPKDAPVSQLAKLRAAHRA